MVFQKFTEIFEVLPIDKIHDIAFESGFAFRVWKKISPENYLNYMCAESIKGYSQFQWLIKIFWGKECT